MFLFAACFVLSLTLCAAAPTQGDAENSGCSKTCTDYHRLCPALSNSTFMEAFKASDLADDIEDLPETADCSQDFFRFGCPQSCGLCTPCSEQTLEESKGTKEHISILRAEADTPYYGGQSIIENTFNGDLETDDEKHCYVSKNYKQGWVTYTIPRAQVKKVEIFSINHSKYSES